MTSAFKRASAAVIAPLDYTHMIWPVLYGYLFWGHLPGLNTWIGTAIIVCSGLYIIFREHRISCRQRAAAACSSLTNQSMIDSDEEDESVSKSQDSQDSQL